MTTELTEMDGVRQEFAERFAKWRRPTDELSASFLLGFLVAHPGLLERTAAAVARANAGPNPTATCRKSLESFDRYLTEMAKNNDTVRICNVQASVSACLALPDADPAQPTAEDWIEAMVRDRGLGHHDSAYRIPNRVRALAERIAADRATTQPGEERQVTKADEEALLKNPAVVAAIEEARTGDPSLALQRTRPTRIEYNDPEGLISALAVTLRIACSSPSEADRAIAAARTSIDRALKHAGITSGQWARMLRRTAN